MYNIDLHIHSRFAYRTSPRLNIKSLIELAIDNNIDGLGTGDILHPEWRAEIIPYIGNIKPVLFLTTEVILKGVHYLLIFPNLEIVDYFYNWLKAYSLDINVNGRCNIRLEIQLLITTCINYDVLIGLAHAFSPGGHFYKYKTIPEGIAFIECGIDFKLEWLNYLTLKGNLMTFSDAHSLESLGRAYTTIFTKNLNYHELKLAILKKNYSLNSGFGEIGRFFETGKRVGTKEIVTPYLSTNSISTYSYQYILNKKTIIETVFKTKYGTKKYEIYKKLTLDSYKQKIKELYTVINYGKDGYGGKLKYTGNI
jgi:PHP family Zn ribbon phosphoesterase